MYKDTFDNPQLFLIPTLVSKLASPYSIFYTYNECFQQNLFSIRHTSPTFFKNLTQIFQNQINDMSDTNSAIFVPSCSLSPTNDRAGSTPYVIASPPPDSPTDSKAAWPHQMMLEHVATILGADVEEVHHHFPTNRSLLPIDVPPPCPLSPNAAIPSSPTLQYPGTELEHYIDPSFPNSPLSVSLSSSIDPLTHKEEWENRVEHGPQLHRSSPWVPLADITPIRQVSHPLGDTMDYKELAMVLYRQVSDQDAKIKELMEDKENQALTPTDPQPSTHPGPGWLDNFNTTGTHHLFVIPLGDEDIIAPFIHYDLRQPFPELLATNRHYCTVHSRPLHAFPQTTRSSLLSPHNELFFHPDLELTRGVNWAVLHEDEPTLAGEIQYFCSHKKACDRLARHMGQLQESLEIERQALYYSSTCLTQANTLRRLQCHIDSSLHITPSFSTVRVKKICASVRNHVSEERQCHPKECMWCSKVGHTIDDCYCIGLCHHCSRQGHPGLTVRTPTVCALSMGTARSILPILTSNTGIAQQ